MTKQVKLTANDTIPLIGAPTRPAAEGSDDDLALRGADTALDRISIPKLQEQLRKLSTIVEGDLVPTPASGKFAIDEIKIAVEMTASGELGFVVAGLKGEAKGSIELTFRRPK
jgi:hypothetical protein